GKRLSSSFQQAYSGSDGWHGVAVLEEGMTWQAVGMTNSDAEFLATRQFQVNDIARWFRVPPHMIADLSKATFSNIEQQSIEFVTYTLSPWIRRFESMLENTLLTHDDESIRIETDALLRGTTETRFKAYGQAIKDGWMTRNEVRSIESLNPIDGLDQPLRPLNMAEEGEIEGEDDDEPTPDDDGAGNEDTEVEDDGTDL
ncbi:phage portal protein, partial [bacterium]|nr:phage portal protein [bacterium]